MLPGKHLILNEIAILALFAISLDLILGYAGIVSLGHAAFFGIGAFATAKAAAFFELTPLPTILASLPAGILAALIQIAVTFLLKGGIDVRQALGGLRKRGAGAPV